MGLAISVCGMCDPTDGNGVIGMLPQDATQFCYLQLSRPSTSRRLQQAQRCMCQAADRRFDLVTTDVDGTLLSSKNELSPRNEEAIAECIKLGIPVSAFDALSVQLQLHVCREGAHQAGLRVSLSICKSSIICISLNFTVHIRCAHTMPGESIAICHCS